MISREPYRAEFWSEALAACDANNAMRACALRFSVLESWVRHIKQQRGSVGQIAPKKADHRLISFAPGMRSETGANLTEAVGQLNKRSIS